MFTIAPLIVSGGQTGADRAALDAAIALGLPYGGWCPRGGWAEDLAEPPGLLAYYPALHETPLADPAQRTEWNLRDSTLTLILTRTTGLAQSPGALLTEKRAHKLGRPCLRLDISKPYALERAKAWLGEHAPPQAILNVAGPRESEIPGLYRAARDFLERLLASEPSSS